MKKIARLFALILIFSFLLIPVRAETSADSLLWKKEAPELEDYAFTFAFVGDTQIVTYQNSTLLHILYDYLADNKDAMNLRFVAGLGDITDASTMGEWTTAVKAIQRLDGVVPYSLVRGNHDLTDDYLKYITYDSYMQSLAGSFDGTPLNTYHTITVGTIPYLFLNLDFGAGDEVLAWARDVVESHPEHNVIITTHSYIHGDGALITETNCGVAPSLIGGYNDGDDMWNKLVRLYPNIIMVVSGHIGTAPWLAVSRLEGDHGNQVQQILIDPQRLDLVEPTGTVALFHFSADGKTIQIENYATIKKQYYGNLLTVTVNCLGGNANTGATSFSPTQLILPGAVGAVVLAAVLYFILRKKK